MKIVILAAGKGSRLGGNDLPKTLTLLADGTTILGHQLGRFARYTSLDNVMVVVGYHKEAVMEAYPDLLFIYSPHYSRENTSKSLLRALHKVDDDLLWINGDVVFHPSLLKDLIASPKSCMAVIVGEMGEEEVKYRSDAFGRILEVSKTVSQPQGEAVGINLFKRTDLPLLREGLEMCADNDYFEKGIEYAIGKGLEVRAVSVPSDLCMEIDFPEDLGKANKMLPRLG